MSEKIIIRNAAEHNLRNVSLDLPRDSLVVVTGVSGSGKSSLAFDTIFQEGQRKYLESLSSYARQFIGTMKSPQVEHISGISPTVSIDQKTINRNPRSTVGTVTEILDHLRLLYARLGEPKCPECGDAIEAQAPEQIVDGLIQDHAGKKIQVMAPVIQDRKGEYRKELKDWARSGFLHIRVDGEFHRLDEKIILGRYEKHTLELVTDRLVIEDKSRSRLQEAVEQALKLSEPVVSFAIGNPGRNFQYQLQSTDLGCARCRISFPEIEPRLFSFNVKQGACPHCNGLGRQFRFTEDLVIVNPDASIDDGAIGPRQPSGNLSFSRYGTVELTKLAQTYGFSLKTPWNKLSREHQEIILNGSPDKISYSVKRRGRRGMRVKHFSRPIPGVLEELQAVWDKWHIPLMQKYMSEKICPSCEGARLNRFARSVYFRKIPIWEMTHWTVEQTTKFFHELKISDREHRVGREIFREIRSRLGFLSKVGLNYLNLDRSAGTLSGGEAQRIRLASQVGAGLQGVLYVLDEPSIGLHPRDNDRLLGTLETLRDNGNSLIVVEHDEDTMRRADHIVDIGPGAGKEGGEILAEGSWSQLKRTSSSLTGKYLNGKKIIPVPAERRTGNGHFLKILGAKHNNLKDIDVEIPLNVMVSVTGASGSGKSSLINGILKKVLAHHFHNAVEPGGEHRSIEGLEHIDKVIEIDQSPIGRTPRSNPATYTKVFDDIRSLFSELPESKVRGYKKGRFSFNVKGGRCEECEGSGYREVEMQIMSNVQVPCDLCDGRRFNDATLEIHYKGKTIADVLDLSVSEGLEFFQDIPKIKHPLQVLQDIGLGYIHLGQPSTTLSGGEAQRMKLATELRRPATGNTLYLLDEPTTGLHFEDITRLLHCLQELIEKGNSVVVIEHNLDVVKCADWVIDLGPDGGVGGGYLLAKGTPEEVASHPESSTGKFLRPLLPALGDKQKALPTSSRRRRKKTKGPDIEVRGAHKHNLKEVNVSIPRHQFTVITGVSGSGKSSLAFHTLFAEGQRRFVESLSTYARRFLGKLQRGQVEAITGLAPAIAIDQNASNRSPRSTVATVTELYDHFRILFARLGVPHCPVTGQVAESWSVPGIWRWLNESHSDEMVWLTAPLYLKDLDKNFLLRNPKALEQNLSLLKEWGIRRIIADGSVVKTEECKASSRVRELHAVVDRVKITEGNRQRVVEALEKCLEIGRELCGAFADGRPESMKLFSRFPAVPETGFVLTHELDPRHFSFNSHWGACETCQGLGQIWNSVCPDCGGKRLQPAFSAVTVGEQSIANINRMTVAQAYDFFKKLKFSSQESPVAEPLMREIQGRLDFLMRVGLDYLNLDRTSDTLSGGEAQRIRLASQIGSGLEGVLYVLDEPTIGLHQKDTQQLIETLYRLRDLGNTVVVVEHDLELISAADHVIDMGPAAGEFGGQVVAEASPKELTQKPDSLTGDYLAGRKSISSDNITWEEPAEWIELESVTHHNLKDVSVRIPTGAITSVTGVSGSGKSSLISEALLPMAQKTAAAKQRRRANFALGKLKLPADIDAVVLVDQSPLSATPRSTPVTVTKLLDPLRDLYAGLPQSKIKGYSKSRFSYNHKEGRCQACEGRGFVLIEMHFLSDVWEPCEVCKGKRYNQETLRVEFKGRTMADVLDMRVSEALDFFSEHPRISRRLEVLNEVGLGYIKLGQGVNTLSGGEAQRLKLANELSRSGRSRTLYLLDEPSTGLHPQDISRLWKQLRLLSGRGDTVVCIEHQTDMIRASDYVIDLGPGGGEKGGKLLYQGPVSDFIAKGPQDNETRKALRKRH